MTQKIWIKMKRGLFRDPKHRQQMSGSVWLFGYLIDSADWETGVVDPYKDEDVADDMAVSLSWVRKHRRNLEELGYIKFSQHGPHGMRITIMNWSNPRAYDGEVINKTNESDTNETPSEEGKGVTKSSTKSVTQGSTETIDERDTPTLYSNIMDHTPITSGVSDYSNQPDMSWIFPMYFEIFAEGVSSGEHDDLKDIATAFTRADVNEAMRLTKSACQRKRIIRKVAYMNGILQGKAKGKAEGDPEEVGQRRPLPNYSKGRKVA